MHFPKYVPDEAFMSPMQALRAGKTCVPEVLVNGGVKASAAKIVFTGNLVAGDTVSIGASVLTAKAAAAAAVGKIVFTGNLVAGDTVTINGKVFTAMASGAAGQFQFNVDTTLALSLVQLAAALNACTDVLVSYAAYTITDTNTSVTSTSKTNSAAFNGIVLASSHVSVVVTAPVGGVPNATASQFDVAGSLSLSLDALVAAANASVDALIALAVYTKTDTATALTATWKGYGAAGYAALASSHTSVVVTQAAGAKEVFYASMDAEHTQIAFPTAFTADILLADGDESQRKTISMLGLGTANIISPTAKLPGATVNYAMNGADVLVLQFLAGKWRLILNDGAVAS